MNSRFLVQVAIPPLKMLVAWKCNKNLPIRRYDWFQMCPCTNNNSCSTTMVIKTLDWKMLGKWWYYWPQTNIKKYYGIICPQKGRDKIWTKLQILQRILYIYNLVENLIMFDVFLISFGTVSAWIQYMEIIEG